MFVKELAQMGCSNLFVYRLLLNEACGVVYCYTRILLDGIYTILVATEQCIERQKQVAVHCASAVIVVGRNTAISITRLYTPSCLALYYAIVVVHPITVVYSYVLASDVIL